jgi:hypothetical protein
MDEARKGASDCGGIPVAKHMKTADDLSGGHRRQSEN